MADAQETLEAPERPAKEPKRRLFGRKKEAEPHGETDWVDTLVAHTDESGDDVPGSPFSAGSDLSSVWGAPPAHDEAPMAPTPRPTAPEAGPDTDLARTWVRRDQSSMEDIHHYIDHVLGTEFDPARRRERRAMHHGSRGDGIHVEGLDQEIAIAFTFPRQEFRSARVVYETEGGHVIEVVRAVGGDDDRRETQYYTVSRVGQVAHVLDKLRAMGATPKAAPADLAPPAPVPAPVEKLPFPNEPAASAAPMAPPAPRAEPPAEAPDAPSADDTPAPEKAGRFSGLASRFKRKSGEGGDDASTDPAGDATPGDAGAEGASDKGSRFTGLASRFKRKAESSTADDSS